MKFLENLKLDTWWGIVLYLGVGAIVTAMTFSINFLSKKHLSGLGFGMILIGLSYFIADTELSTIKPPNVYTGPAAIVKWRETHHGFMSILLLVVGGVLAIIFGGLIISELF